MVGTGVHIGWPHVWLVPLLKLVLNPGLLKQRLSEAVYSRNGHAYLLESQQRRAFLQHGVVWSVLRGEGPSEQHHSESLGLKDEGRG